MADKNERPSKREMSVREAGKKGGDTDFYEEIGHKGGQKVKKLIAEAKKKLGDESG
jgi:general stress protein YciG